MKKILLCCLLLLTQVLHAAQPYPLQELNESELAATRDFVLKDLGLPYKNGGYVIDAWSGNLLDRNELYEPAKQDMYSYLNGGPIPQRQAIVGYYDSSKDLYYKYLLNLTYKSNGSFNVSKVSKNTMQGPTGLSSRPSWTCNDSNRATCVVLNDPTFQAAMFARGLNTNDIFNNVYFDVSIDARVNNTPTTSCPANTGCQGIEPNLEGPLPNGKSGRPRVIYMTPYWSDGLSNTTSAYIQPIEGIEIFFDRISNQIIKVVDTGAIVPVSKGNLDWCRPPRNSLKPIVMSMPEGPSYTIDQNRVITWENWKFSVSFNPRYGIALHNITYKDKTSGYKNDHGYRGPGVTRSILYRAHISELETAYGTPDFPMNIRNFLDISEYPVVSFLPSLIRNVDIPPYAQTFPLVAMLEDGSILQVDDAFAIYEQDAGVLWRHVDYPCVLPVGPVINGKLTKCATPGAPYTNIYQGKRGRQLVLTHTSVISNYDYSFYWIFNQDGTIDVEINPTGVIEAVGKTLVTAQPNSVYHGNLVNQNVVGVNHFHRFCARLDFDIDGQNNTVFEHNVLADAPGPNNPCSNGWAELENLVATESYTGDHNFETGRSWTIENVNSQTSLGYNRAYELEPWPSPSNLIQPCERIGQHANFSLHNVYVTKFRREQMDAEGELPVEQPLDYGIASALASGQSVDNQDIVLWYASGFAHDPRVEDYPVMPREKMGFSLKPHSFFEENPALDVDDGMLLCADGVSTCCACPTGSSCAAVDAGYSCTDHGVALNPPCE